MAMSAPRSSVFTFESTVHSFHVLRGLDEQRRRDVLCDVTVVAEGQSFRAHRSVLASCSEYFSLRVSSLTQHGAVVTVPEEVTADGFKPLLNFAYTSKLLFGKDNALEIRNAASVLGFRDLDEACFDFVLPKFSASSRGSASFVRKTCCKKKCKRRLSKAECGSDSDNLLLDEKEVKPVADSSAQQEALWVCDKSGNNKMGSQSSTAADAPAVEEINDVFMQCPKYRKFQLACGKENCDVEKKQTDSVMAFSGDCSHFCSPCSSSANTKTETELHPPGNSGCKRGADEMENTEIHEKTKSCLGKAEAHVAEEGTGWKSDIRKDGKDVNLITGTSSSDVAGGKPVSSEANTAQSEKSAGLTLNHCPLSALKEAPGATRSLEQEEFVLDIKEDKKASHPPVLEPVSIHKKEEEQLEAEERETVRTSSGMEMSGKLVEQRKTVEREKTQKLASWHGQDACSSQDPEAESSGDTAGARGTSLEWLKLHSGFSTAGTSCPFFQNLDQRKCLWKGTGLSESEGASPSGVSSLNSGEDGDSETETEGDSESYARERARQVQLPFSVDWVVNLNRNDFQQLLKQQVFTREQLEFVHDMRRRSKNRLAAQRCRKRKLDCIYNLQCEINKLKTEREKLMMEKSQLSQLKLKTCHSVSALCQRVCDEANLQPEQLHVLAKYTSPDCPLSSLFPHIDALLSQHAVPHGLAPNESPSGTSTDTNMGQQ